MTKLKENNAPTGRSDRRQAGVPLGPIIIVDDLPDEARLAKRSIAELNVSNPIEVFQSGTQLIAYLQQSKENGGPAPVMILLDLHMNEMNGFAVLEWVKAQSTFASIPIVALTGVENPTYVKRAYQSGATTFLRKPMTAVDFQSVIKSFSLPVQFA